MRSRARHLLQFDGFFVDLDQRVLFHGEQRVRLSPKTFDTLAVFLTHPGELLEKDVLIREIWGNISVEEGNLTQHIFILRKVFSAAGADSIIETVPKRGYRFLGDVREKREPDLTASAETTAPLLSESVIASAPKIPAWLPYAACALLIAVTAFVLYAVGRGSAASPRQGSDRPVVPLARADYLKGRFFWNKRTEAGYLQAIAYFRHAIRVDPNYASAYAGLADASALLGSTGNTSVSRVQAMEEARHAARKALQLDPSLSEAHTSLAFVLMHYDWNFAEAEKEFRRAVELNPGYATAHQWHAYNLAALGRMDEALAENARAAQADPVSLIIATDRGELLFYARRYDDAILQLKKVLQMDPNYVLAHEFLGLVYAARGDEAEALAEGKKASDLSAGEGREMCTLSWLFASAGRRSGAERILHAAECEPAMGAAIYIALGEKQKAFADLNQGIAEHNGSLIVAGVNPLWDPVRSDPRFAQALHRIGASN